MQNWEFNWNLIGFSQTLLLIYIYIYIVNFKLINRLRPIVNVIIETFLRFKCTPIVVTQESFKETFSRLSCNR